MSAEFSIKVDPHRNLVRATLSGFFERADIERFIAARNNAHQLLLCAPNHHLTLADLRKIKIQSQECVAIFAGILADPTYQSRKLAFVAEPSLTRSQLQRVASGRSAMLFSDVVEAEAWLLSEL